MDVTFRNNDNCPRRMKVLPISSRFFSVEAIAQVSSAPNVRTRHHAHTCGREQGVVAQGSTVRGWDAGRWGAAPLPPLRNSAVLGKGFQRGANLGRARCYCDRQNCLAHHWFSQPTASTGRVASGIELKYRVTFKPESKDDCKCDMVCVTEREKFLVKISATGTSACLDCPDMIDFSVVPVRAPSERTVRFPSPPPK